MSATESIEQAKEIERLELRIGVLCHALRQAASSIREIHHGEHDAHVALSLINTALSDSGWKCDVKCVDPNSQRMNVAGVHWNLTGRYFIAQEVTQPQLGNTLFNHLAVDVNPIELAIAADWVNESIGGEIAAMLEYLAKPREGRRQDTASLQNAYVLNNWKSFRASHAAGKS